MQTTHFYVAPRDPTTGQPVTAGDRAGVSRSRPSTAGMSRPTSASVRPSSAKKSAAPAAAKTSSRPSTAEAPRQKSPAPTSRPSTATTTTTAAPAPWRPSSVSPTRDMRGSSPPPRAPSASPKKKDAEPPLSPRSRAREEEFRALRQKYELNMKLAARMAADQAQADERIRQLEEGFENATYNYGLIKFHHDRLRRGQNSISEEVLRSMLKPVADADVLLGVAPSSSTDEHAGRPQAHGHVASEGAVGGESADEGSLDDEAEEMEARLLADKYLRDDRGAGEEGDEAPYPGEERSPASRSLRQRPARAWEGEADDDGGADGPEGRRNVAADRALEQAWKRRMLIEPEVEEPDAEYPSDDDIEEGVYGDSRAGSRAASRLKQRGRKLESLTSSEDEAEAARPRSAEKMERVLSPGYVEDGCYEYSDGEGDQSTRAAAAAEEPGDYDAYEYEAGTERDDGAVGDVVAGEEEEGDALTEADLASPKASPGRLRNESLLDQSAERISSMWDQFDVEAYEPRVVTRAPKPTVAKGEQPRRATVPEPFKFHYRPRTRTRSERLIEEELYRKRLQEEALVKGTGQFRANPLPATTLLPMYQQMEEDRARKSEDVRRQTRERLLATQKPFSFYERDVANRMHRLAQQQPTPEPPKPNFRAQPAPRPASATPGETYEARVAEEEALRKMRIQRRARELMLQASLPSSMVHDRLADTRERRKVLKEREQRAFFTENHTFRPTTRGYPPDFDAMATKLERELRLRKAENRRRATVVKPFDLRTDRIPSRKDAVYEDVLMDEMRLKETRWPYVSPRRPPVAGPMGAMAPPEQPTRPTRTTELREQQVRKSKREEERARQQEARARKMEAERLREIETVVVNRVGVKDSTKKREEDRIRKVAVFRANDRRRQEEYQRQLEQIEMRTAQRPLIFDRPSEVDARKAVERRLEAALAEAGLTAKEIRDIKQYLGPSGKVADVDGVFRQEKGRSVAYDPGRYSEAGDTHTDITDADSLEQRLWAKSPSPGARRAQPLPDDAPDSERAMSAGTLGSSTEPSSARRSSARGSEGPTPKGRSAADRAPESPARHSDDGGDSADGDTLSFRKEWDAAVASVTDEVRSEPQYSDDYESASEVDSLDSPRSSSVASRTPPSSSR